MCKLCFLRVAGAGMNDNEDTEDESEPRR